MAIRTGSCRCQNASGRHSPKAALEFYPPGCFRRAALFTTEVLASGIGLRARSSGYAPFLKRRGAGSKPTPLACLIGSRDCGFARYGLVPIRVPYLG